MERDCQWRDTRDQQLLTSLRESIVHKPPYISGTLQVPDSFLSLFFKVARDSHAARHIDFSDATPEELEHLTQACEAFDGKMDSKCFSSTMDFARTDLIQFIRDYLLEGDESTNEIEVELHKLNAYGKDSFLKPHVDSPRSKTKMFGSLVVVFPTFHEGGALFLRHRGHEWIFDSGQALAAVDKPTIGYVAFFSNIEHQVAPVTSGHRVTLTYNLYFGHCGPVPEHYIVSKPPQLPIQGIFREAFEALLGNPEFMADGGTLAFGLRHVYPMENGLDDVHEDLKGSDKVVYQSVRALGFESALYVYYDSFRNRPPREVIVDRLPHFYNEWDIKNQILQDERNGARVHVYQEGEEISDRCYHGGAQAVEWVTPVMVYIDQREPFISDDLTKPAYNYGCGPRLDWVLGGVCIIVRIGKAGDRLAYPTAAQVRKAYGQSRG